MLTQGFQSFVAWRYLMARPMRLSRPIVAPILAVLLTSLVALSLGFGLLWRFESEEKIKPFHQFVAAMSPIHDYDGLGQMLTLGAGGVLFGLGLLLAILRGSWRRAIGWSLLIAGVLTIGFGVVVQFLTVDRTFVEWSIWFGFAALAPLALLLPLLIFRFLFTFFTTVSMAGVFVGAMALVVVLSVMSGFESDLRDKILGTNAHIRVTKEEGSIADWEAMMAKIKGVPGVVAVTPYATSEVVLSANSNYASVIIKGIDPATVGGVTELIDDLEEPGSMARLYPLTDDGVETRFEVDEPAGGPDGGLDDAPLDLPGGGDPIDYSGGDDDGDDDDDDDDDGDDDRAPADMPDGDDDPADLSGDDDAPDAGTTDGTFGGDAVDALGDLAPLAAAVDPAPADFGDGPDAPDDFSGVPPGKVGLGDLIDRAGRDDPDLLDLPPPADSGRLALLDGVLVGAELRKQLHLFSGQEVRLVSPLADPANPDATGTPIPFHRDYRIAGFFYTGMYEYDLKFVYVPIESLQEFLQLGEEIDGIEIRITDAENTDSVRGAIARMLGSDYIVQDWKELNRNLFSALKLEKIAMFLVLAIIILVASFSIIGNLIMVVVEKSKEIALLKTLGASDIGVMRVFVMQGFFIGLCGTLAGLAEGLLICLACQRWGFPINPDVYYIDKLPIQIEPLSVAAIAAAGLVISAVATLYPALVAARLRPAVGLRHD